MSIKAYFVRINSEQEQDAVAKLIDALKCPDNSPDNGWFNYCARATNRIPDPNGRKTVSGQTIKFGYEKGDLVAAISADNPHLDDWFLSALEDEEGKVNYLSIPYFTMLEDHPRSLHENGGSQADDFEEIAYTAESYNSVITSAALKKTTGLFLTSMKGN